MAKTPVLVVESAPKRPRGRPPELGESLDRARRRKESALADLREMEVRKRKGELLVADDVRREWQADYRRVRSLILAVPGRIRQRLPHLQPDDVVTIDRELRDALADLADDSGDA